MSQHIEGQRYSRQDLEEFREIIEKRIAKSQEQLTFYLSQLDELNESSDARIKSLDDGTSAVESVRISTLIQREQKMLQHLDQALIRINNGTYGICSVTGMLIPKERLRLVPHATKSVEGKLSQN